MITWGAIKLPMFWATTLLTELATCCAVSAHTQPLLCGVWCQALPPAPEHLGHALALNRKFETSAGTPPELPVTCSWGCAVQLPRVGRRMPMCLLFLKSHERWAQVA